MMRTGLDSGLDWNWSPKELGGGRRGRGKREKRKEQEKQGERERKSLFFFVFARVPPTPLPRRDHPPDAPAPPLYIFLLDLIHRWVLMNPA